MARKKIVDDPEFDAEATINLLDQRLARLRVLYEQYFLGIEKRQPTTPQKEVVRLIRLVEKHKIRNTSLKFRFNGIVQKFTSYRAYWLRTCRQIENGTYVRHKQRVQTRDQRRKATAKDNNAEANPPQEQRIDDQSNALADDFLRSLQLEIDKPSDGPPPPPDTRPNNRPPVHVPDTATPQRAVPRQAHTTPPPTPPQTGSATERLRRLRAKLNRPADASTPSAASQAQRNASREAGISNDRLQSIYKSLVSAKQRCSEPTAKISVDSVARSIAKQAPLIKQKHNAKAVDFKVVIKNGKAYLKPVPKP